MPVYRLDHRIAFPDPEEANDDGVIAVGGDLSPERLIAAYAAGIFPWYEEGLPIIWHSPDPRMVLPLKEAHLSRSLNKEIRRGTFAVTFDSAFEQVITRCATTSREGQGGTWITTEMTEAYIELHRRGFAHSVEAWKDGELAGGLYGVSLGNAFFGESMFARVTNASKVAFATLVRVLQGWGFSFIDCQVHTDHLQSMGAREVSRRHFLALLDDALNESTRRGPWAAANV